MQGPQFGIRFLRGVRLREVSVSGGSTMFHFYPHFSSFLIKNDILKLFSVSTLQAPVEYWLE